MGFYQQAISEATGVTDETEIREIEDVMRGHFGTLSHLPRDVFDEEARIALDVCISLGVITRAGGEN